MELLALLVTLMLCFGFGLAYAYFIYWMDRYEKEPKILLGAVFLWGAVIAVIGALIFEIIFGVGVSGLTSSQMLTDLLESSISAPLAEEVFKSAAVLLVFLFFRKEFDSILDGIVYACIVALGFAATENVGYLYSNFLDSGWSGLFGLFFLRVIVYAWAHPLYTSFTGIGLAMARTNRSWLVKILAPLVGLGIGMFLHGLDNGILTVLPGLPALVSTFVIEWTGWLFIIGVMIWAGRREGKWVAEYLREEVERGIMSPAQYHTAYSSWKQTGARLRSITDGGYRATGRFYQVCGELAHKKRQYAQFGDEGGNLRIIQKLEAELASLARSAQA